MNSIALAKTKTAYAAPQLTVFGGVAELTAAGSGTMNESTNRSKPNRYCGSTSQPRNPCVLP